MIEASRWLEQNQDADKFFLVVESFDPHEPWFVPEHYRRMYDDSDGREHVASIYSETDDLAPDLLQRAQANFSGLVTMCDRWFSHLFETVRTLGLLDNTAIIVVSDHGHSIGDRNYMGKRGYPSDPAVFDIAMLVRHPDGIGAGQRSDLLLQHTDISAQILEFAGVEPTQPLHGQSFWKKAVSSGESFRDHVTVGWGSAMTVIDDLWWMNCKVDGTGVFLYDLIASHPFVANIADDHRDVIQRLYAQDLEDAGGEFPEYLLQLARSETDAPGCSALAARA